MVNWRYRFRMLQGFIHQNDEVSVYCIPLPPLFEYKQGGDGGGGGVRGIKYNI